MKTLLRLFALALLVPCFSAGAEQHLMSIREVYVGPTDDAGAQYVVLQMYMAGQNKVGGHTVEVFDAGGNSVGSFTFADNVAGSANQSYILIATAAAETRFSIDADMAMTAVLPQPGGMVCFETFDCFSWGNYAGTSNPSPTGTPFNAAQGLSPGAAVRRDISGGSSSSTLEASDDTNDSDADFEEADSPAPRNNGGDTGDEEPPYGQGGGGGGGGYGGGAMGWLSLAGLLSFGIVSFSRRRL